MATIVRSRISENIRDETASIFHANTEMKNGKRASLSRLKINGNIESNLDIIEDNIVKFFHSLFNGHHDTSLNNTGTPFVPDNSGLESFLDGLESLPDCMKEEMEANIELDELTEVVMKIFLFSCYNR